MRFLLFLILCPILLLASDNAMASGQNYIVRRDYLKAAGTEYVDVVEYFDGLGRSVETVQRGITPSGQSLVTVREYDSQSRLAREWQPVVSPNTDFKFDRGGEITYRNDGEGRRMEVTHRISSASASLAGKPVPSAAYKTVLKRKYIDHFVYRNDTLEYILTPTGYIDRDGNYYHYQKDSRGSVRTVLDGAGLVVERNDYYPYGMLMDGVSKSVQPYKFGGKELDRIGGINHYDFHARQLQLPIPHFYQQDPYADKYPHLSPYLYCAGNPLRYVDPSGKIVINNNGIVFNQRLGEVRNYIGQPFKDIYARLQDDKEKTFIIIDYNNQNGTNYEINTVETKDGKTVNICISLDHVYQFGKEEDKKEISPALIILHELGHADAIREDYDSYIDRVKEEKFEGYSNKEEKRNIVGVEKPAAEMLGEPVRETDTLGTYIYKSNIDYDKLKKKTGK